MTDGYYEKQFARFDDRDGRWAPTWNWAAGLFGMWWYWSKRMLYRGIAIEFIWLAALALSLLIAPLTVLVVAPARIIVMGLFGNYHLYQARS